MTRHSALTPLARTLAASLALCACRPAPPATTGVSVVAQAVDAPAALQVAAVAPAPPPAPPPPIANCTGTRRETMGAECWFAGHSCEGRGGDPPEPFVIRGTLVEGGGVHGGCNPTTFALVYERGTTTLRLRVCALPSAPMDCPATIEDRALWDIAPLLAETGFTRAVLVRAAEPQLLMRQ